MATFSFPQDIKDIPKLKGAPGRPPRKKDRAPAFPTGPRHLALGSKPRREGTGPGLPPEGFLTAHNSTEEWWVYWAIATLKKDPPNPRVPPFIGGEDWSYQRPESPTEFGIERGRVAGGSVSDFVVNIHTKPTIIRLQTELYHVFASPQIQERDLTINVNLRGVEDVIDIFSQDWLHDETGQAVCKVVALALKGIEYIPPMGARSAVRVRNPLAESA